MQDGIEDVNKLAPPGRGRSRQGKCGLNPAAAGVPRFLFTSTLKCMAVLDALSSECIPGGLACKGQKFRA
jgi:hypothetical protein